MNGRGLETGSFEYVLFFLKCNAPLNLFFAQTSNHSEAFDSYTKAKAYLEQLLFTTSRSTSTSSYPIDPIEASRVLLNRSICAYSLEHFEESFNDADMAKSILKGTLQKEEQNGAERSILDELRFRLRKAYFRCAKASEKRKDFDGACELYLNALEVASPKKENSNKNTNHLSEALAALVAREGPRTLLPRPLTQQAARQRAPLQLGGMAAAA